LVRLCGTNRRQDTHVGSSGHGQPRPSNLHQKAAGTSCVYAPSGRVSPTSIPRPIRDHRMERYGVRADVVASARWANDRGVPPYIDIVTSGMGNVVPWRDGLLLPPIERRPVEPPRWWSDVWKRRSLPRRVLPWLLSYGAMGLPRRVTECCRGRLCYARNMSQDRPPTRTLRVLELCQGGNSGRKSLINPRMQLGAYGRSMPAASR